MELLTRKDVPEELTWDLTALYKTEEIGRASCRARV